MTKSGLSFHQVKKSVWGKYSQCRTSLDRQRHDWKLISNVRNLKGAGPSRLVKNVIKSTETDEQPDFSVGYSCRYLFLWKLAVVKRVIKKLIRWQIDGWYE